MKDKTISTKQASYFHNWYLKNRTKKNAQSRKWYAENKEKAFLIRREWIEEHRDRMNVLVYNYHKRKYFGGVENYYRALNKNQGKCVFNNMHKAELVHHIDGKSIYNSLETEVNNHLDNLLPLCKSCHNRVHQQIPIVAV